MDIKRFVIAYNFSWTYLAIRLRSSVNQNIVITSITTIEVSYLYSNSSLNNYTNNHLIVTETLYQRHLDTKSPTHRVTYVKDQTASLLSSG